MNNKSLNILAIETSCDETAAALLQVSRFKSQVLRNVVSSQVKIHRKYGGIVPEVAARKHVEVIIPIIDQVIGRQKNSIDLICVTAGPGLITSLMVGIEAAKTLSYLWHKPLMPINHLEGHIYSNWLSHEELFNRKIFQAICLVVSGGHTELYLMTGHNKYQLIGRTRDDAAGEAFDKVAKILNIGYPGGPAIAKQASQGKYQISNPKYQINSKFEIQNSKLIKLPRPMIKSNDFDFSFSGLKTAVLYEVKKYKKPLNKKLIADFCASFQKAVVDVLVVKTIKAARLYQVKTVMLSGGVSANQLLREELQKHCQKYDLKFYCPDLKYTGDNAAMIAMAGYYNYLKTRNKKILQSNWQKIKPEANWELK